MFLAPHSSARVIEILFATVAALRASSNVYVCTHADQESSPAPSKSQLVRAFCALGMSATMEGQVVTDSLLYTFAEAFPSCLGTAGRRDCMCIALS